ncbi:MAG: hypothetical protein AAGA26_04660 [Pseudomonadota bacterium]
MSDKDKDELTGKDPIEAETEELDAVTGGTTGRHSTVGRFSASASNTSEPAGRFSTGDERTSSLKTTFVAGQVDPAELEELEDSSEAGRFQKR